MTWRSRRWRPCSISASSAGRKGAIRTPISIPDGTPRPIAMRPGCASTRRCTTYRSVRRDRRSLVYFEPGWYRQTYGLTPQELPLAHSLARRCSQRGSPNSLFDAAWFVTQIGRKLHRRRDPLARYLFAGTWEDLQPSRRFDAIAWRKRARLRHRMVTLAPCPSGGGTESPLQTEFTTVVLGPAHGPPPHSGQRPNHVHRGPSSAIGL
jgi:hypothetical protein